MNYSGALYNVFKSFLGKAQNAKSSLCLTRFSIVIHDNKIYSVVWIMVIENKIYYACIIKAFKFKLKTTNLSSKLIVSYIQKRGPAPFS